MAMSVAALGAGGGNATISWTLSITGTAASGALVIVSCTGNGGGTLFTTPSDSKGNTYASIGTSIDGSGSYAGETMMFYSLITTGLAPGDTITATQTISRSGTMVASAVTGVTWAASPLDTSAGNNPIGTATSLTSGSTSTTSQASELVWAIFASGTTVTFTAGGGYTPDPAGRVDNGVFRYVFSEWLEQTSASAQTATATTSAATAYHSLIATFKAAAGSSTSHFLTTTGAGV